MERGVRPQTQRACEFPAKYIALTSDRYGELDSNQRAEAHEAPALPLSYLRKAPTVAGARETKRVGLVLRSLKSATAVCSLQRPIHEQLHHRSPPMHGADRHDVLVRNSWFSDGDMPTQRLGGPRHKHALDPVWVMIFDESEKEPSFNSPR